MFYLPLWIACYASKRCLLYHRSDLIPTQRPQPVPEDRRILCLRQAKIVMTGVHKLPHILLPAYMHSFGESCNIIMMLVYYTSGMCTRKRWAPLNCSPFSYVAVGKRHHIMHTLLHHLAHRNLSDGLLVGVRFIGLPCSMLRMLQACTSEMTSFPNLLTLTSPAVKTS